jgi:dihydrofolate reductase
VVAADEMDGIARGGDLPWRLPRDLAHFKRLTSEAAPGKRNAVFMGRVTWETIPPKFRPLPGRINLVLTGQAAYPAPGALRAHRIEDALAALSAMPEVDRIFCVGGAAIYDASVRLPECDRIYLTRVYGDFGCDTFFHAPLQQFELTASDEDPDHQFRIDVWRRRP